MKKKSQKSVLHFMAVRNANVFGPISMTILEPVELRTNLRKLLTHIVSLKTVSATLAEGIATIFRPANSINSAWF